MPSEWSWNDGHKRLVIDGETVVVTDDRSQPSTRTFSPAAAFADPRLLFLDEPGRQVEVLRALAEQLSESDSTDDASRRRRTFWRSFSACRPLSLSWSYTQGAGTRPIAVTLDVSWQHALATLPPAGSYQARAWQTIDDLFFYGPLEPGIPAAAREQLIATVLAALSPGSGVDERHAFPAIGYDKIAPKSWEWNQTDDGESGASIGGASVVLGYRYGHDYGAGTYSVERILTGAPEIRSDAPKQIWDEILAALAVGVTSRG